MSRDSASTVRVVLNAEAFAALVAGEMATVRGVTADGTLTVEIILSDIGFAWMRAAIDRAAQTGAPIDVVDLEKIVDLSKLR